MKKGTVTITFIAASVLTGLLITGGDMVMAGIGRGGGNCCFTQKCGSQTLTACSGVACVFPEVCKGAGGCTPGVWATASCGKHAGGGPDPVGP